MGKNLTSRAEDYSKWYNELVVKSDLAENSGVRGCMVIKPYGYAIWEKMQAQLDKMFKETLMVEDGYVRPSDRRGIGIDLNEEALMPYRVG